MFARGGNGAVWARDHSSAGWGAWHSEGGNLLGGTGPSAAYFSGITYILAAGTNKQLYLAEAGLTGFKPVGGLTTATPALTTAPGALAGFVRGTNGVGYFPRFLSTSPGWSSIGGQFTSGLGAANAAIGGTETFTVGLGTDVSGGYSASILAWVEAGGVYAIAALRGGGEEGEEWHRAGMRERKQNVFDDFHAAAERLIADGWTTSRQLAISGGSNGGLLVGTAITQRPGLYAAAVCSAPLLDMVRYERFGLGETWNDEFGTAADPEQLGWLLGYSPYHHVREGTAYPAVLFSVFDSDTRVDPMHARKMCAALQHASSAALPGESASAGGPGHAARRPG